MKNKQKKVIVKDAFGTKWWVNLKTKETYPANWKIQSLFYSMQGGKR